jgi:Domain of unknown function (DUF4406)
MQTIYICGKVTGLPPEQVKEKFEAAQDFLYDTQQYCRVVNPVTLVGNPQEEWKSAMHTCLKALIDCSKMYLLHDWQTSRGARLEVLIAYNLGINIVLQDKRQQQALELYLLTYTWKTLTPTQQAATA